jgi:hypothetical protein
VKLEDGVLHTFPLAGTRPRAGPKRRIRDSKRNCWPTKRSAPSTTCWWTWGATTWGSVAASAAWRWKNI